MFYYFCRWGEWTLQGIKGKNDKIKERMIVMRKKEERLERITKARVTAEIRTENKETGKKTADTCLEGGVSSIEVSWTIPEAEALVQSLNDEKAEDVIIGAGTIINETMAEEAIRAGAEFLSAPNFSRGVCDTAVEHDIPYLAGCMTVNEMMVAEKHGASMVHLFPGNQFTPDYIKAVKTSLPHLALMPGGGVSLENIQSWFEAGASAAGIGSEFNRAGEQQDYEKVRQLAEAYMEALDKK